MSHLPRWGVALTYTLGCLGMLAIGLVLLLWLGSQVLAWIHLHELEDEATTVVVAGVIALVLGYTLYQVILEDLPPSRKRKDKEP